MWIKRNLEEEISKEKSSILLLGPRQVGKSSLLSRALNIPLEAWLGETKSSNYLVYNLLREEEYIRLARNPQMLRQEVIAAAKGKPLLNVIIDEVQRVPELLNEVQSLIDFYKNSKIIFFLTGSSARKLKRGGANLLPGRVISKTLSPLMFHEWEGHSELLEVLKIGALPKILTVPQEMQWELLKNYVTTYLKEEIQAEGIVRGIGPFSRFIEIAGQWAGKQINFNSLSRESGVAFSSIRNYFQILEDTLVGFLLPAYSGKTTKRLSKHPKFYLFDLGVRNALIGLHPSVLPKTELGTLFEQFIILEILRISANSKIDSKLYFWRTNAGAEVDCVLEAGGKTYAIEIKAKETISAADSGGLRAFASTYPKQEAQLMIISMSERQAKIGDVLVFPWKEALKEIYKIFTSG